MRLRLIQILAVGLTTLVCARAQHYAFRNYGVTDGLRNLNVDSLFQDHEGFLWIGTDSRLFRYDGTHFDEYSSEADLPQTEVNCIAEDAFGHLWVGTTDGVFVLSEGHFKAVTYEGKRLQTPTGKRIESGPNGMMYVAEPSEIVALRPIENGRAWQGKSIIPRDVIKRAAITEIQSVLALADGSLLFGADHGLCRWSHDELTKWTPASGIPRDSWSSLFRSKTGEVWARGDLHVSVLPVGAEEFVPRDLPRSIKKTFLPAFAQDASGTILANAGASLARWQLNHWELITAENGLQRPVNCLLSDQEGTVWLGALGHGLYKWLGYDAWQNWTLAEGLENDVIWSIRRDNAGTLWVGHERGLSRFDETSRRFVTVRLPKGMRDERIQSLADIKDNYLWAASSLGHLARINIRTLRAEQISFEAKNILRLRADSRGRIWIASENGLYTLGPRDARPIRIRTANFDSSRFLDVIESPMGFLFARSDDAIIRFDGRGWLKLNVPKRSLGGQYAEIDLKGERDLWTDGAFPGVTHFDLDAVSRIRGQEFLPRSQIGVSDLLLLEHDQRGWTWLGGSDGISSFDGNVWRTFTEDDGLAWNDIDSKAFWQDADGSLWFGTSQGLSHLTNPAHYLNALPLHLKLLWGRFGARNVLNNGQPITLPTGKGVLSIGLIPVSLHNEKALKVKHRLIGLEQDWIESRDREILYPHLEPGDYRFEATAIDATYGRQSKVVSFRFKINPPWWKRGWFLCLLPLFFSAVMILLVRWRTASLVTRQQELERIVRERTEELANKKIEAEQASIAKSGFLAMMSHEIRTPLNGLIGMTDMLRGTRLNREQLEYVDTIQISGDSLLTIINDVLDFSKIEAGKMLIDPIPFRPARLIADCKSVVSHAATSKGVRLETATDDGLPSWLLGDVLRLRQIVLNLLSNAIKFTAPGGTVLLNLTNGRMVTDGTAELFLKVSDTGIGISPQQQRNLFQSFSQADASTTRKFGGTGLGLAICKRLVELMKGEIGISSTVGVGSVFWIRIPLPIADERHPEEVDQAAIQTSKAHGSLIQGRRVLVAEDNPINQKVISHMLRKADCQVTIVGDGQQASQVAYREFFDLILMDCQMPELDGFEATKVIRSAGGLSAKTPIIAVTANALEGERERCLASGMNDYLSKPIRAAQLRNLLDIWLKESALPPASGDDEQAGTRVSHRDEIAGVRPAGDTIVEEPVCRD